MALGAMSVDELTERGMGRFVKEVTDKNGVMSKVVDKAALIKYGTTQMAASLAGDLGGNLLGTTLFPDKDPAAVSMGTSLAMSGVMLGQMTGAFTGAFSWMAGPLGIVAGGLLGGLLGGLFGGRKKSPEELQLEENRKNFQKRIEDILSRIDKNLGPQADYYRSINGQVMYGSASAWFSGRAYDRMGILSTLGRR